MKILHFAFRWLTSDFLTKIAYISCFLDLLYTLIVVNFEQKPTLKVRDMSPLHIIFSF